MLNVKRKLGLLQQDKSKYDVWTHRIVEYCLIRVTAGGLHLRRYFIIPFDFTTRALANLVAKQKNVNKTLIVTIKWFTVITWSLVSTSDPAPEVI